MALTPEQYEDLLPVFAQVANEVHRQYHLTDREDLVQECWVWALSHPGKLQEYLEREQEGQRLLYSSLRNACRDYARKDKAQRTGYHPDDEIFYALGVLKDELLPAVYKPWEQENTGPSDAPSGRSDPAHGNDWLAELADVSAALSKLDKYDRLILAMHYRDEMTVRDIGAGLNMSHSTVHDHLERAVKRVHRALGGSRPYSDPPEYVGTRKVISNHTALAITRDDYDSDWAPTDAGAARRPHCFG